MRLYWEVARRGFRRYSTYVGATVAGLFTNSVFGFIKAYVIVAVFAAAGRLGGYASGDALTYNFVTQGLAGAVAIWSWFDVDERIRTGDIATDLIRPYSFTGYWLSHDLGRAAYQAVARGVPPFALGAMFFRLRLPANAATWPAFAVSVLLAVGVSFGIRLLINETAFWLLDSRGVYLLALTVWTFLSGLAIPLAVFPGGLRTFARATPFAATFDAPAQIFVEKVSGLALAATLASQLGWAVVALAAARWVLALGTRKLVIQGG